MKVWWKRAIPIVLSAVVLPGLGQLYMRRYVRGAILASVFLAILIYMTMQMMHDAMALSPSNPVFSSYFAELLQECMASFEKLLSSWGAILAVMWGYSLADTVRLARRWEPRGEAKGRA